MSREIASSSARDNDSGEGSAATVIEEASAGTKVPSALSVGQQLAEAREARGLDLADVAKSLKISLHQVVALESDDWANLPTTITRGFVRNYARMLGLDSDPLMSALARLEMPQEPELAMPTGAPVSISQEDKADRRDYVRVFSGLIILALAVLAYFFFPPDMWQSALSVLKSITQSNELVVEKNAASPAEETRKPEAVIAPPEPTVAQEVPAPAQAAVIPALPGSSLAVLKFNFARPAWVEVRDRSGEIIFSQLSQAGSQREIEGRPPFALVVGNSTHVTLQYKGKSVEFPKRSKDDVARLTLE